MAALVHGRVSWLFASVIACVSAVSCKKKMVQQTAEPRCSTFQSEHELIRVPASIESDSELDCLNVTYVSTEVDAVEAAKWWPKSEGWTLFAFQCCSSRSGSVGIQVTPLVITKAELIHGQATVLVATRLVTGSEWKIDAEVWSIRGRDAVLLCRDLSDTGKQFRSVNQKSDTGWDCRIVRSRDDAKWCTVAVRSWNGAASDELAWAKLDMDAPKTSTTGVEQGLMAKKVEDWPRPVWRIIAAQVPSK